MLEMRELCVANGSATSTFGLIGAGGRWVDYDYRFTWHPSGFVTVLRPLDPGDAP